MRPAYLKIVAVMALANLAALGQSATTASSSGQTSSGQTSSGQTSSAQTSSAPTPSAQNPSGQASNGQALPAASTEPVSAAPGVVGQASNGPAGGQSLGDLARSMREKQNAAAAAPAPAKVITNQDLGEGPDGRPELRVATRPVNFDRGYAQPGQQRGEQWRSQILEQKNRIANLQARIDRINASLHSGAQFEGAYSHDQALKLDRVSQLQMDLDEQKRRLEGMQDAARRAGLPSQSYDP